MIVISLDVHALSLSGALLAHLMYMYSMCGTENITQKIVISGDTDTGFCRIFGLCCMYTCICTGECFITLWKLHSVVDVHMYL